MRKNMTPLPPELGRRLELTCWVEGAQIRWNGDMPKPQGLIPGAFWIQGTRLCYVDQVGIARELRGEIMKEENHVS